LLRHARSGHPGTLAGSAVLAGLAALTKIEIALAIAAAHGAFLLTVLPRPSWPRIVAWASGLAVAVGGYFAAACESNGLVWRALFELPEPPPRLFISHTMGAPPPLPPPPAAAPSLPGAGLVGGGGGFGGRGGGR